MVQSSIQKDYYWNTLGVLLQNAISPLLIVVITRLNGIDDSGLFSFAFSVAVIFWAIGMWGGRTYQVSDVNSEFSHRSYIMVRLLLAAGIIAGAGLFSVLNRYDQDKTLVILTLVTFKAIESIADALYGVLQVHDRLFIVGKSLTYKALSGILAFALADLVTDSVAWGCLAILVVNVVWLVVYDIRITRKLEDISIRAKQLSRYTKDAWVIMRRCLPVFGVLFLDMFALNIPRYYLDQSHPDQVGYYGIIAMPLTLVVLFVSFILQPKIVSLSLLYSKKKYQAFNAIVKQSVWITIGIGTVVLLGTIVIGAPALHWVFNLDFEQYRSSLIMIVFGGIANALVALLINMLIVMRVLKQQAYILIVTNILLVIFSGMIIPSHALFGGVTLFMVTSVVQALLLAGLYTVTLRRKRNG